jgi:hypothetical protein
VNIGVGGLIRELGEGQAGNTREEKGINSSL